MTASPSPPLDSRDLPDGRTELGLASNGEQPQLRADAARNRARLLEAAAGLVAVGGVANLTMEAVAAAAKVGKGTVFRRFGDRFGLLQALLAHREEQFQAAFMAGPPPLGPDAPAMERLCAFGPAVIRHEHAHDDLYVAARTDAARNYTVPAHRLRLTHVAMLLRQTGAGGDTELLAQSLLSYLDPALVHHLLTRSGMPLERLEAGWYDLVARLTAGAQTP
ncbi:TetR/AcrR family transcriptional regulator [Streptomyces sp. PSKA54]|uniref:TetR/AcrR family transcriptional regulator n=1 Tax=Streptomyces himalayensis subsp. aureolus TaxID=2758039 RepID=A0A7W2HJE9_9ACTN|nr:TetR/AcrR family transcriptional regulator [Streptomyces himalayensis]MBA4866008.1 TetR/AcrR family transcriptional regulator [Streptomyces himalayensis subsp. aureolus]